MSGSDLHKTVSCLYLVDTARLQDVTNSHSSTDRSQSRKPKKSSITAREKVPEPEFVNLSRSPRTDFQPGGIDAWAS
jgi:hypothetical protein